MDVAYSDPLPNDQYQIGWICALSIELEASLAVLDERHGTIDNQDARDTNSYHAGKIQGHNVVLTCLPHDEYGTNAAAVVATNMLRTFHNINCGLLVGIAGGLPSDETDLRLGDVVVSSAESTSSGVIQIDLGKKTQTRGLEGEQGSSEHFIRKGTLNRPPLMLRSALASLRASGRSEMFSILQHVLKSSKLHDTFQHPTTTPDQLYLSSYVHPNSLNANADCSMCDPLKVVARAVRPRDEPRTFYGTVLSGNVVIKSARERDKLRDQFHSDKALCVEMEAAGIMNVLPCMVIRGICDYADSHKNDKFHAYAALTAAAFARSLLLFVPKTSIEDERALGTTDILGLSRNYPNPLHHNIDTVSNQMHREAHKRKREDKEEILSECHQQFHPGMSYEETKNIVANRANGTCLWVLDDPKFISWNENRTSDLLWVSASPGCGKSVLCKNLVDEILPRDQDISICYFFFRNSTGEDMLWTALCSILHQIFTSQPHLRRHALDAYKKYGPKIRQEVDVLWKMLLAATSDSDANQTICVIDALDEASVTSRQSLIRKLCHFFQSLTQASTQTSKLKFLVTSRPYDEVRDEFEQLSESLPKIRLQGEDKHEQIGREIDQVIDVKVEEIARRWRLSTASKRNLQYELLSMEHRTYLWLELAADSIDKTFKYSSNPESAAIKRLPKSVDDAYQKLLSNVDVEVEEKVKKILLIIVGARRTLTIGELCLALGIYEQGDRFDPFHMQQYMRQWCGLFIFFNQGKVYLIHQTAKDFLLENNKIPTSPLNSWSKSLSRSDVETIMAMICVRHLCSKTVQSITFLMTSKVRYALLNPETIQEVHGLGGLSLDDVSFYLYSTSSWLLHINESGASIEEAVWSEILSLYLQLLRTRKPPWVTCMWEENSTLLCDCDRYPIFLAMTVGHLDILQRQIGEKGFELEIRDHKGRTPLMYAAEHGFSACVDLLAVRGAKLNVRSETMDDSLLIAVGSGHVEVVRVLLGQGADPNSIGCSGHPLIRAAFMGQAEISDVLLEYKSSVNARGGYYGNALQTAAYYGHFTIVEALLKSGATVNEEGGAFNSAIQAACVGGWSKIVQLLIQYKANVNQEGGLFNSPLLAAVNASLPNRSVIKMLLDSGARADVCLVRAFNVRFTCSTELLSLALASKDDDVLNAIQHKLGHGRVRISCYPMDLQWIMNDLRMTTISLKLRNTSFLCSEPWRELPDHYLGQYLPPSRAITSTKTGITVRPTEPLLDPLAFACAENDIGLVKDLLAAFAATHRNGDFGTNSPLHEACNQNNEQIVRLLIDDKADVNARQSYIGSPLQLVCRQSRNRRLVAMLLEAGADVNCFRSQSRPPLHEACKTSDIDLVKMLLLSGADVDVSYWSGTPLSIACDTENVALVEMLLENGADIVGNPEISVFKRACKKGNHKIIQMLINKIMEINVPGDTMREILFYAVNNNDNKIIVEALLRAGIDVNLAATSEGITLLHLAARGGHEELVELLLQHGGDPNTVSVHYGSVAQAAVRGGKPEIIQMLHSLGANLNLRGGIHETPLHAAAFYLNCDMVATLLKLEVDVEMTDSVGATTVLEAATLGVVTKHEGIKKSRVAQHLSSTEGRLWSSEREELTCVVDYIGMVEILTRAGATGKVRKLFEIACEADNPRIAASILYTTWPVQNEPIIMGHDALQIAWSFEAVDTVSLLMARNPTLRHLSIHGIPILDATIQSSDSEMLYAILKSGLNVNPEHSTRGPPLYQAALLRSPSMVGILLAAGSVINAQAKFDRLVDKSHTFYGTSLHAAVRINDLHAAKLLVAAGADMFVPGRCVDDHHLCNALETAEHFGHTELARWLKNISRKDDSGAQYDSDEAELGIIRAEINTHVERDAHLKAQQDPVWIQQAESRQLLGIRPTASQWKPFEESDCIQDWAESGSESDWNESDPEVDFQTDEEILDE